MGGIRIAEINAQSAVAAANPHHLRPDHSCSQKSQSRQGAIAFDVNTQE